MNTRKRTLALGLALALGAGGAGFAIAHGMPGGMMGYGQGGMGPGMMGGGMGPGMMGGGMGPGMMSGGMGPGMMGGGMMPCPMMGGPGMGMMQQLLTPEQHDEMRELMQQHRPTQLEHMGQMLDLHDELVSQMQQARPDPEAVQELHGRMAELQGEMLAEQVRQRNAMHDLLTDEQRQQLQEAMPYRFRE
ncbi:Spy/CpxP family protein refolding chaperone [Halomonas sp. M4R5S39]|uniref:Spy/CpxP family protein refolding chaperone n=1 Tax=Halomonas kalidii TaxID=3043293 RepID=UPI0024A9E2E0|nr:Spy/CpxP family protein refolding chaperone [Halomonas kalidii]MDI5986203.1 Spy/CpxP family protein refolding chaperone [Halomonas kalidii]